ncbi:MAG TPA: hypothetical protein DDZ83_14180, partial [Nitrospinae bacterium]|nr:hypothetical protein [Nitrospinota bacterium]
AAIRLKSLEYKPERLDFALMAYRMSSANAGWDDYASFGSRDFDGNPWAGGLNGALLPGVDYVDQLLGSVSIDTANPALTQYDLVIPGALAQPLIHRWSTGGVNEGFLIRANPPGEGVALTYSVADSEMTLQWAAPGFALFQNPDLSNSDGWTVVGGGDKSPVMVTIPGTGNKFYTLQGPGGGDNRFAIHSDDNLDTEDIIEAPHFIVNYTPGTPPGDIKVPLMNVATGVQWAPDYVHGEVPVVGATEGENKPDGLWTSTQLRFNFDEIKPGSYESVNSMTLKVTTRESKSDRVGGELQLYQLAPRNAGWNNGASYAYQTGTDAWLGGENGARVPGVDHFAQLLASTPFENAAPVGTVYELVIPGELAQPLVDRWARGGPNEGFLITTTAPGVDNDNRLVLFGEDDPKTPLPVDEGPQLFVNVTPPGLSIIDCPQNITVIDGEQDAMFQVVAAGVPPLGYRWFREGAFILESWTRIVNIPAPTMHDDQSTYVVEVHDSTGLIMSDEKCGAPVVLTVLEDVYGPCLLQAKGAGLTFDQISVKFDEGVEASPEGFALSGGVKILDVQMTTDPKELLLLTSVMEKKTEYTLTIVTDDTGEAIGVWDLKGNLASDHNTLIIDGVELKCVGAETLSTTFTTQAAGYIAAATDVGGGADWACYFSNRIDERDIVIGFSATQAVSDGMQTAMLRFDVTPLRGKYDKINSITVQLTSLVARPQRDNWVMYMHRLSEANADWDGTATHACKSFIKDPEGHDGRGVDIRNGICTRWVGGACTGALVPGVDYVDELLATVETVPSSPRGKKFDLVINDSDVATKLIDDWSNPDNLNEGFLLWSDSPDSLTDTRGTYIPDGEGGPIIIIDFDPAE